MHVWGACVPDGVGPTDLLTWYVFNSIDIDTFGPTGRTTLYVFKSHHTVLVHNILTYTK